VDGATAGVTALDGADVVEPKLFVAVTVKVYEVPFESPVTTSGEDAPEAVKPPGLDVAVYVGIPVPICTGSEKATVTCWSPNVPTTLVGAPGAMPAPNPNLRVAPLPMRFTNGIFALCES
jgi:hypothetical protein